MSNIHLELANGHDCQPVTAQEAATTIQDAASIAARIEPGERLTRASKAFGGCDLYVGDDGKLYI
jgi:hypothetical protein